MSMARGLPDITDITAEILESENRALEESQAKLQTDFEVSEAKFNADLEALAAKKPEGHEKRESTTSWLLARKCWAWLDRH
jgi:hypothetical protein